MATTYITTHCDPKDISNARGAAGIKQSLEQVIAQNYMPSATYGKDWFRS
jgi:hypothetical protein